MEQLFPGENPELWLASPKRRHGDRPVIPIAHVTTEELDVGRLERRTNDSCNLICLFRACDRCPSRTIIKLG